MAQLVKNPPAIWETWVQSLGGEDPLKEGKATHSVFRPGEFHGLYSSWGRKESDMTERFSRSHYPEGGQMFPGAHLVEPSSGCAEVKQSGREGDGSRLTWEGEQGLGSATDSCRSRALVWRQTGAGLQRAEGGR